MSTYRRELGNWVRHKKVSGRILDVGGHIWSVRHRVHKESDVSDYTTLGLEPKADITLDLTKEAIYGYYDHIFCTEVMEFVVSPLTVARNVRNALCYRGKAYFTFHFKHPKIKGNDYLRYTKKAVNHILPTVGLVIDEIVEPIEGYYLVECHRR